MKKTIIVLISVVLFCLNAPLCAVAEEEALTKTLEVTKSDLSGKTGFLLNFELGGASVNVIRTTDNNTVIKAVVTYYESGPEPSLGTKLTGTDNTSFQADFTSGFSFDGEFPWGFKGITQKMQTWEITIGATLEIETELSIMGGAIIAESIDLGGLPLTYIGLMLGGASLDIDFSTPTTRQVEDISIECGGTLLELSNIGNTDFVDFSLMGGGNISVLDFRGTYGTERHDTNIIAAGSMTTIKVPEEAGVNAGILSIAAPVFTSGDWERNVIFPFLSNIYKTEDYADQDTQLFFDITTVAAVMVLER